MHMLLKYNTYNEYSLPSATIWLVALKCSKLLLTIITSCIWKTALIGCFNELQLTLIHLQLSFISNMKARSEILLNKSTESKESKSLSIE